ncbi:MAG: HlyD family efflux transporter periplasmic adaptor subunit [Planctomycetaceae bacterium]|nr:HlyD family efflux transporter periplasmic adaptor subunit [Planctomycetaceae bacterium]
MKSCIWLAFVAVAGVCLLSTELLLPQASGVTATFASKEAASTAVREVFAAGVVEGAQRSTELEFELSGKIVEIPVVEGQVVQQGDICARLDDAVWRHKLAESEAALQVAQAELERLVNGASPEAREVVRADARVAEVQAQQAKAHWDRAARLFEQKAMPAQDYDQYRYLHDAAVARLAQARAQVAEIEAPARQDEVRGAQARVNMAAAAVAEARTQLERAVLRAPIDGVILTVEVEPGERVAVEQPQAVVSMTSLSQVRVRAFVEELDALSLQPGAAAFVVADGNQDVRYSGRVTWAAPVMGPKSHRHHRPGEMYDLEVREVLIVLDDAQELVVGLPVDVFIAAAAAPATTTDTQHSLH